MSGYNRDFSRKTAAAAAAVCIGIPIVNVIYDFIPYPVLGALLLLSAAALIIYGYEHAIIGTREENPVISGVSELVPFSF